MKTNLVSFSITAFLLSSCALSPAQDEASTPEAATTDEGADTGGSMAPFVIPSPEERFPASDLWPAEVDKTCGSFGPGGTRNDYVDVGLSNPNNWGAWGCIDLCPAGSYAGSVSTRQESSQGSGDDTGLNAIHMSCFSKATGAYTGFITSRQGSWGSWTSEYFCPSEPAIGGLIKWESSQGSGDDYAATGLEIICQGGGPVLKPPIPINTGFGSWYNDTGLCPAGSAVCGIETAVEGAKGSGDDTALNAAILFCCTF